MGKEKKKCLNQHPETRSVYLSCDEWSACINGRCEEVDELALVLTVDLAVEVRQPVAVGL